MVAAKIKKTQVEIDAKLAVVAREKADAAHTKAMTDLEAKMQAKGIKEVPVNPLKPIAPMPGAVQAAIARKNIAGSASSGSAGVAGGAVGGIRTGGGGGGSVSGRSSPESLSSSQPPGTVSPAATGRASPASLSPSTLPGSGPAPPGGWSGRGQAA